MNLLELFENLGILTNVCWHRQDGVLARIDGRTVQGRLRVSYQWRPTGAWVQSAETWDDETFLRNFEPERSRR